MLNFRTETGAKVKSEISAVIEKTLEYIQASEQLLSACPVLGLLPYANGCYDVSL
jgi:hypothetical protein